MGGRLGAWGIEQKGKRTHGHGPQCGDCWGKGCIKELNGNGTIKIKYNNNNTKENKQIKFLKIKKI